MEKVDLKEVMRILRSGEWIDSLWAFTADIAQGTGGQIIEYKNCRIARRKGLLESNIPIEGTSDTIRSANHNANFTINIELKNKQIRKLHPILIFEINKQPVI